MRELKFRAWDGEVMGYSCNELESWYESSNEGWETLGEFFKTCYGCEIMQYTELKDKNGKEIWESDLIQRGSGITEQIGPVIFDRGCFFMEAIGEIPWPYSNSPAGVRFVLSAYESEIEVIGNLYENPELIND